MPINLICQTSLWAKNSPFFQEILYATALCFRKRLSWPWHSFHENDELDKFLPVGVTVVSWLNLKWKRGSSRPSRDHVTFGAGLPVTWHVTERSDPGRRYCSGKPLWMVGWETAKKEVKHFDKNADSEVMEVFNCWILTAALYAEASNNL